MKARLKSKSNTRIKRNQFMTPGVLTPVIDHLIIHYDEIGLKCSNRGSFERRLMKNIRSQLGDQVKSLRREQGQLTLKLAEGTPLDEACDRLSCVAGIAYFSPACKTPCTLEAMSEAAVAIARQQPWETFKIDAHRHDKTLSIRSMDANRTLGAAVTKVEEREHDGGRCHAGPRRCPLHQPKCGLRPSR